MPARESKKKNTKNADRLRRQNAVKKAKAELQSAKEEAKAIKAENRPVKEANRKAWSDRQHVSNMLQCWRADNKVMSIGGYTKGRSKSFNLDDSPFSIRSKSKARNGWGKSAGEDRSSMPQPNLEDHHRKLAVVLKQVRQIKADKRLLADEEWPQYCDPYGYVWQAEADAETDAEAARRDFYCGEA